MNRLGVLGGTFDPPHVGHRALAAVALQELQLDLVLWIPANVSPHKTSRQTSVAQHRLEMVRRTINEQPLFKLDTRELERPSPSYTVDTLESLHRDYPEAALFLIMGEDSLASFSRWKSPERIRELAQLVVYRRQGEYDPPTIGPSDHLLPGEFLPVESTQIREAIKEGAPFEEHVTPEVATYIKSHGLYLPDES